MGFPSHISVDGSGKQSFDSVNRQMLLEILRRYGIPEKLVDIIRRLHTGNSTKFKINGVERVFEC